jgi:flagellar biosynthetic protein FliQ
MSSWGVTDLVLRAVREGLLLVLLVSAPPLLASMLVGLVVGAFQAASQIHDSAVAFVPKLVAAIAVLLMLGPVLGAQVLRFTQALLLAIATIHS